MEEYKGRIDISIAKKIISDHYDVYLKKTNPCSRTVCSHYELDGREYMSDPSRPLPYQPRGAIDGIVGDSEMTKNMSFMGIWGSSCGREFNANNFFDKNKQWMHLKPYIFSRPSQPWIEFKSTTHNKNNQSSSTEKGGRKNKSIKIVKRNTMVKRNTRKKLVLEQE
jgi:hypothetical protein